jgi:hypothetical protein
MKLEKIFETNFGFKEDHSINNINDLLELNETVTIPGKNIALEITIQNQKMVSEMIPKFILYSLPLILLPIFKKLIFKKDLVFNT